MRIGRVLLLGPRNQNLISEGIVEALQMEKDLRVIKTNGEEI